ncbi:hypothetical protein F7D73_06995 [Prevotella copri]|uniref:Uncharacterized protein n=3 Tax=Prevotellaceae TaxID=171552 RepID=A0A6G1U1P2_9BACT|nr:hypothetical protein [Segatella copri]
MSGKNRFLLGFVVVVCVLALVRLISPGVAEPRTSVADLSVADSLATDSVDQLAMAEEDKEEENKAANEIAETSDDLAQEAAGTGSETDAAADSSNTPSIFFDKNGKEVKHRIFSVPHFGNTFPDQQDVQILAANKYGVNPVQNREEAEHSKGKLVYVGSNPFFYVDKLNNSIPYLVPRASVLLQDIGRAYFDSLQIKGIPLHKIIVTSILRTKDDVAKLRTRNGNATENSCHLYGTTFDVCYNRYKQIQTRQQPRRQVQNDTLKWVLSEVLRDMRDRNRCLVKYEVKQGCFHITVK